MSLQETFDESVAHLRGMITWFFQHLKTEGKDVAYMVVPLPPQFNRLKGNLGEGNSIEPIGVIGNLISTESYSFSLEGQSVYQLKFVLGEHDLVLCQMLDMVYQFCSPASWEKQLQAIAKTMSLDFEISSLIYSDDMAVHPGYDWHAVRAKIVVGLMPHYQEEHLYNLQSHLNEQGKKVDEASLDLVKFANDILKSLPK